MRIGIDVSRANKTKKTGVEWYAYFLVQEMKKLELKDVILYSDTPLKGELADLPDGWTSKILRWPPKRLWTQLRLSWEMLINPPDVLFIPAHVPPVISPKKSVMTIHDVAAARYPASYNWFERWYSLWTAKHAVKKLAAVIVPTEFTKKEVQDVAGNGSSAIHVVHHGYHIESKAKNVSLADLGITKPYLLSVGRIEEKKNTKRLVAAFNQLKADGYDYQLVLVGKPGHGYEVVEQAITTSPYKDDIIRPGWIDQATLAGLYAQAGLFVYPSLYEGFGLPLLESFACSTPVVTATGSCLKEIAGDAAIYIDPLFVDSLVTHIKQVLDDDSLQKELIEAGKKRLELFDWEKTAKETVTVLQSL